MPWWSWLVIGVGLLGVELFGIDAQFYLVFLGAAAVVVGLIGLADIDLPVWAQWLTFSALAIITMLAFRARVYALVRGRAGVVQDRLTLGDHVVVPANLRPGESCRLEYRGTSWNARNVGEQTIEAGEEATISRVDELTLHVKRPTTQL